MSTQADAVTKAMVTLDIAARQFLFYAQEHERKGSEDKAKTNHEFSAVCADALEGLKVAFPHEAGHA